MEPAQVQAQVQAQQPQQPAAVPEKKGHVDEVEGVDTLMVFVDGSESSDKAFHMALKYKKARDTLYVVHIPRSLFVCNFKLGIGIGECAVCLFCFCLFVLFVLFCLLN